MPLRLFKQGMDALFGELDAKTESGVRKAHNFSGATLAQKVENAIADAPKGGTIEIEPNDDGTPYGWDQQVVIDPNTAGGITLDFDGAEIDATVDDPLVIDTGGTVNLDRSEFGEVKGGSWRLPSTGNYVIRVKDCFRWRFHSINAVDNGIAILALENHAKWSENIVVKHCFAISGPGVVDFRPASVTGGTGTASFMYSQLHDNHAEEFTDFAFRFRGLFNSSDFGFNRGVFGADGSTAFIFDANFQNSMLGPIQAENPGGYTSVDMGVTTAEYGDALFRGISDPDNAGWTLADSGHIIPKFVTNWSGPKVRDHVTGDQAEYHFASGQFRLTGLTPRDMAAGGGIVVTSPDGGTTQLIGIDNSGNIVTRNP